MGTNEPRNLRRTVRWTSTIRLPTDGLRELEVTACLPASDARQRIVSACRAGSITQDAQGNRTIRLGLADFVRGRATLAEDVEIVAERTAIRDAPFPLTRPSRAPAEFLEPSRYVNPGAAPIRELAGKLSRGKRSCLSVLVAFVRFCNDRIRYDCDRMAGAFSDLETLKAGAGSCDEKSHVLAGLCRAVGIPAAVACGRGEGEGHAWVEIAFDGVSWFPVETTYHPPQLGWVDAGHLKLVRAPDCDHDGIHATFLGGGGGASRSLSFEDSVAVLTREGVLGPPCSVEVAAMSTSGPSVTVDLRFPSRLSHDALAHIRLVSTREARVNASGWAGEEAILHLPTGGKSAIIRYDIRVPPAPPGHVHTHPVTVCVDGDEVQRFSVVVESGLARLEPRGG